tara:strand:- start:577 stop:1413 length:837 start_codon:yes stop_codon:yes gene_type:complete
MITIKSISEIVNKYENYIIDQWGVMHNGEIAYKHAIETIDYLEKKNKNLFIISNSSKRQKSSKNKLPKLGFNEKSFVNVLTSGEMIWHTINKKYSQLEYKKKCFHIYDETKEDGLLYREGLNLSFVDKIDYADFILACTPFSKMQPIDYIPILDKGIDKNLVMYCANPDFETVEKNNSQNIFCMGAIAELYKKMGGQVIVQGKPEKDIYVEATLPIKLDKTKTIAVGDSIFHDIKGANNFSVDSILVKSGIHKDLENIKMLCKNHQIEPTYLIQNFSL